MARLLISVRNAQEAQIALAGGAALVDVKEPSRGSLGRADAPTLSSVLDVVARVCPVSAAMGELRDWLDAPVPCRDRLAFVKWGLAGAAADWQQRLITLRQTVEADSPCRVVVAGYADHRRADAPLPRAVCHFAIHERLAAVLFDTWHKDGTTLLDWLSVGEVADLVEMCRSAGVQVALAGSLGRQAIEQLLHVQPDWFAVRGAACDAGHRAGLLDGNRVRALADLVNRGG